MQRAYPDPNRCLGTAASRTCRKGKHELLRATARLAPRPAAAVQNEQPVRVQPWLCDMRPVRLTVRLTIRRRVRFRASAAAGGGQGMEVGVGYTGARAKWTLDKQRDNARRMHSDNTCTQTLTACRVWPCLMMTTFNVYGQNVYRPMFALARASRSTICSGYRPTAQTPARRWRKHSLGRSSCVNPSFPVSQSCLFLQHCTSEHAAPSSRPAPLAI